ncbi:hypothetical protein GCM10010166_55860 [Couchioplanes caeruleus subsp. azureus]|nr:hypothetical protein GCM10010166_55860 [Couchioplanes caeruleus subsp. azureus]
MRAALLILAVLTVLFLTGWLLVPLIAAHAPAIVGGLGMVLLLAALLWPRKRECGGLHCPGCRRH